MQKSILKKIKEILSLEYFTGNPNNLIQLPITAVESRESDKDCINF